MTPYFIRRSKIVVYFLRPLKAKHKCECLPGYEMLKDGFTCKSTDTASPYIIFSNRHEVRALISSLKNTIALDFYHSRQADNDIVFWTDVVTIY